MINYIKANDNRDYIKIAIRKREKSITFAMFFSPYPVGSTFDLLIEHQELNVLQFEDIKEKIFEDMYDKNGVVKVDYANKLKREKTVIRFGDDPQFWNYTSSTTLDFDGGYGDDEFDEVMNIFDICYDAENGKLSSPRNRFSETSNFKMGTYRHKAFNNFTSIVNVVAKTKPETINDVDIYVYHSKKDNVIYDGELNEIKKTKKNTDKNGIYQYEMIKYEYEFLPNYKSDLIGTNHIIKIKSNYKNAKPYKLYLDSDSGYLPIRRVIIKNGEGQFIFNPLLLPEGHVSKISVSSIHYKSLLKIEVVNE